LGINDVIYDAGEQISAKYLYCFKRKNTLSVSFATNGIANGDEVCVVVIGAVV
jgi:hypothetical protein